MDLIDFISYLQDNEITNKLSRSNIDGQKFIYVEMTRRGEKITTTFDEHQDFLYGYIGDACVQELSEILAIM